MRYQIRVLKKAERDLASLPRGIRKKIAENIDALAKDPRPKNARPLKGNLPGHYRIRISDYRIIYKIEDDVLIIVVVRIGHRRDIYRNL